MPSRSRTPTTASRRWRREILAYGLAALLAGAVFLIVTLTSGEPEHKPEPAPPPAEQTPGIQP